MEYLLSNMLTTSVNLNILYIIICLVLLSSFFSMSETVISSIKMTRLESMKKDKVRGVNLAYKVATNYDKTISTILVGNNIVNIAMATLAVTFFRDILINHGNLINYVEIISTVVMTIIILLIGEIIPKTYGKSKNERLIILIAPILNFLNIILYPITLPFNGLQSTLVKHNNEELTVTESEFDSIIDTMEDEGVIDNDEAEMLQSVLNLNDMSVSNIMTHRVDMVAFDIKLSIEDIKESFFENKYSRVPIYEGTQDNVIGILYERDFFTNIIKKNDFTIRDIMKKPLMIPKSMKVDNLIENLQIKKQHLAVVIDEYGGTSGIVTMEDALEELVGEIYDEHDNNQGSLLHKVKENKFHASGKITIEDFFEELELEDPKEYKSNIMAGFIIELFEDIPTEGDRTEYVAKRKGVKDTVLLKFKVKKIKNRRITSFSLSLENTKIEKEA